MKPNKEISDLFKHVKFLRTEELARYLGVGYSTLTRWDREGLLPKRHSIDRNPHFGRSGKVRLWDKKEIDEWVKEGSAFSLINGQK